MSNGGRFTLEDLALYPTLMWDPEVQREAFSRPGTSDQIVLVEVDSDVCSKTTHGYEVVKYKSNDLKLPLGVIEHGIENVGFRAKVLEALEVKSRPSMQSLRCTHCGQNTTSRQLYPSGLTQVTNGRVECSIVGAARCVRSECQFAIKQRLYQAIEDASRNCGKPNTLHPDNYQVKCSGCPKYEEQKGAFMKCSRCRCTYYCGKDCQRAHWPIHKQVCKPYKN